MLVPKWKKLMFRYSDGGASGGSTESATTKTETSTAAESKPAQSGEQKKETKPEKSFTQDEVTRIAAKEGKQAKKALMAQLGLKSEDDITSFLEQQKAIKETQEKAEQEKPELERLQGESKTKATRITELEEAAKVRDAELLSLKLNKAIQDSGYTGDKLELATLRLEKTVKTVDEIEDAVKEYVEKHPIEEETKKTPATATYGNTGKTPLTATEAESLQSQFDEAKKNKNGTLMTRLSMIAAKKGIKLK